MSKILVSNECEPLALESTSAAKGCSPHVVIVSTLFLLLFLWLVELRCPKTIPGTSSFGPRWVTSQHSGVLKPSNNFFRVQSVNRSLKIVSLLGGLDVVHGDVNVALVVEVQWVAIATFTLQGW